MVNLAASNSGSVAAGGLRHATGYFNPFGARSPIELSN